jgi:DNA-binding IclR family transcriptional regulator
MDDRYRIDATQTSLEILELVSDRGGASLTELTNEYELSKTGVMKHLRTLCETGHLVREENTYHVGLRFLPLAAQARERIQLTSVARPEISDMAQAAGEQANLLVEEDGRGIYTYTESVRDADGDEQPIEGPIIPHDETGAGKAILSQMTDERLEQLRDEGKLQNTDPTDFADLQSEIRMVHEQDIAFDRGNNRFNLQCAGTVIHDSGSTPVGAVELVGPEIRVTDKRLEEDFPGLILKAVSDIEKKVSNQ